MIHNTFLKQKPAMHYSLNKNWFVKKNIDINFSQQSYQKYPMSADTEGQFMISFKRIIFAVQS